MIGLIICLMYEKKVQLNVRVPKWLKEKVEKRFNLSDLVYYVLLYYSARIENKSPPLCIYVNNKRGAICQGGRTQKIRKNPERSCEELCGQWERDPAALMDYLRTLDPEIQIEDIILELQQQDQALSNMKVQDDLTKDPQLQDQDPREEDLERTYSSIMDLDSLVIVPGPGREEGGRVQGNLEEGGTQVQDLRVPAGDWVQLGLKKVNERGSPQA